VNPVQENPMLQVIKVTLADPEIVGTEDGQWGTYRRYSADNWEVLMGELWEPLYSCEEAESAYQAFKNR